MNWPTRWKRRKSEEQRQRRTRSARRGKKPPTIYLTLWGNWCTKSDDADPQVDWERVRLEVQQDPSVARYSDDDRRNMHLLHFVCALYPPLDVVEAVLTANPQAVWKQSVNAGITPLMIACGRNASQEIIRQLLLVKQPQHAPHTSNCAKKSTTGSSIRITDASGYSAVHWACREDVSSQILRQLLIVDPGVSNHRVELVGREQNFMNGVTPTDIICRSKSSSRPFSSNQGMKLCLLLWARYYGTIISRNGRVNSTLHAALALHCADSVIRYAYERDGNFVAGVRDSYGNLPLHYAVQRNTTKLSYSSSTKQRMVAKLMHAFPEGAGCIDSSGRLPLHVALQHGSTWSEGVRELHQQHRSAIAEVDGKTQLYPFCLAASFSNLETTYCLLREHPQLLVCLCR